MLYAIVAVLVIIVDQWVKYWVAGAISIESTGEALIPGVISLVNLHNDGAAFGFLSGGGARIYFIILTGVFTVAVILALATKFISGPVSRWSIVLVTAGGLSNCIDRVIYGYVQDMFKAEFINFPVFNVADIIITVFCIVFIFALFFEKDRRDDFEDEFSAEDDEEEDRPSRRKRAEQSAAAPEAQEKRSRKGRRSKYDDEYEQYKAARAARQKAEASAAASPSAPAAPVRQAPAAKQPASSDPFAEWERANARAGVQQRSAYAAAPVKAPAAQNAQPNVPVAPAQVQRPAPVKAAPAAPAEAPKPVKPADSSAEFSLDDILNEFK